MPGYGTCARYGDHTPGLNPFTVREYEAQCKPKAGLTYVCAAAEPPKGLPAACVKDPKRGGFVLDAKCVAALRSAPSVPAPPPRPPTEPFVPEGEVCRTKLGGGDFRVLCGTTTTEVTFDQLTSRIGEACERCCESGAKGQRKAQPPSGEKHAKATEAKGVGATEATTATEHQKHKEHQAPPGYIPFG